MAKLDPELVWALTSEEGAPGVTGRLAVEETGCLLAAGFSFPTRGSPRYLLSDCEIHAVCSFSTKALYKILRCTHISYHGMERTSVKFRTQKHKWKQHT